MIVFRFIAVTTTGGISATFFEDVEILMSFGLSTMTSNLHQLTCAEQREHQKYRPGEPPEDKLREVALMALHVEE